MVNLDAKILITGGTGFAGSHLIEALLESDYKNIYTTVFRDPPDFLKNLLPAENFFPLDLNNQQATKELIADLKPDQIYHLASFAAVSSSYGGVREVLINNLQLQVNLFETILESSRHSRVLVVGSADAYGKSLPGEVPIREDHPFRPANPYAVSKASQELLAYSYGLAHQLEVVVARPFNHFGERQSPDFAIPAFITQLVAIEQGASPQLQVGDLSGIRDMSDVKDTVRAYILLMEKGQSLESYNIGRGEGVSMQAIVEKLIKLSDKQVEVVVDQKRIRPINIPEVVANNAKIKGLGWQPRYTLEESLERTFNWYRQNFKS